VTREELTAVMTALEPDQIISTKEHHHCPRRQLTRTEMIVFWDSGFIWYLWSASWSTRFGRLFDSVCPHTSSGFDR